MLPYWNFWRHVGFFQKSLNIFFFWTTVQIRLKFHMDIEEFLEYINCEAHEGPMNWRPYWIISIIFENFLLQNYPTSGAHILHAKRTVVRLFRLHSWITSVQPNWHHFCHFVIFDQSRFENFFLRNHSTNDVQISRTYRGTLGLCKLWSSKTAFNLAAILEFLNFFQKFPKTT